MYLNCKTYFSFLYGTYGTEELVKAAAEKGITTLALTNINNTCDMWDFVDFCQQQHIRPVAGTEIRNDDTLLYLLLAKNNRGFLQINRFLSLHLQEKKPFPSRPEPDPDIFVVYPFQKHLLPDLLENEMVGIECNQLNLLYGLPLQQLSASRIPLHLQPKMKS